MDAILQEAVAADLEGDALVEWCESRVRKALEQALARCGVAAVPGPAAPMFEENLRMNAAGIAFVAQKHLFA